MNNINEEIARLDALIAQGEVSDREYLQRGMLRWKIGDRAGTITDYETAVRLNPDSPAAQALEMTRDIMDFYDHSRYNP